MKKIFYIAWVVCQTTSIFGITVTSGTTSISGTGTHTNPQLALSPVGRAMSIWTETFPNQVEAAYFNGASWEASIVLATGSFPQVDVDGVGNAVAVWLDTSNNQVYSARFSITTQTWSNFTQLSTSGVNAAPRISVNSSGYAVSVWVLSSPIQIVASTFDPSTLTWSTPTVLVEGSGSFPNVSLDDQNNGILEWSSAGFGIQAITFSIKN